MGSSLIESINRKKINLIRHEGSDYNNQTPVTHLLGNSWKLFTVPEPPTNSSSTAKYELTELMGLRREIHASIDDIRRQNSMHPEEIYFELLDSKQVYIDPQTKQQFGKISDEINTVVDHFKYTFMRPRPMQLFGILGKNYINVIESDLTNSPSYPSNIATKARFFGLILSNLYPNYSKEIATTCYGICFNRVVSAVHYPSDIDAGRELAERLFKDFSRSKYSYQEK